MGIGFIEVADLKEDIIMRRETPFSKGVDHEKKREIIVLPPFQENGVGLSDVTIDTPRLRDQGGIRFKLEGAPKTYKDGTSLIRSVEYCLNKSIRPKNEGEGAAIGVCRMGSKKALVGERFRYRSFMEKNKDPVEIVKSLDKRCRERGGKIQSVFVPL